MQRGTWWPAAAFAVLLVPVAARDDARKAQPGDVAVVDLFAVLDRAQPFQRHREEIQQWIDEQKRTNLEVRRDEIAKKEAELDLYRQGSPERVRLENELAHLKLSFDQEFQRLEQERQKRITAAQREAWEKVREAVAEAARQGGVRLVLQRRDPALAGTQEDQISAELWNRDVLFADPSLDITDDVITILDASR